MLAQRKVLVLNRSWQPVSVLPLEKALNKVVSEYKNGEPKARIIDCTRDFQLMSWSDWTSTRPAEGEAKLHTVNAILRVPTVIQLTKYNKTPQQRVPYSRREVYKRDDHTCQYCGIKPGTAELSIDHVVPKSLGGLTTWENCVLACTSCNSKKANRTPEQAGMKLAKTPVRPKFSFFKLDCRIEDWQNFLNESYWSVELENENY